MFPLFILPLVPPFHSLSAVLSRAVTGVVLLLFVTRQERLARHPPRVLATRRVIYAQALIFHPTVAGVHRQALVFPIRHHVTVALPSPPLEVVHLLRRVIPNIRAVTVPIIYVLGVRELRLVLLLVHAVVAVALGVTVTVLSQRPLLHGSLP